MNLLSKISENYFLRLAFLTLLLVFVYFPVLILDQTVNPDAQTIFGNLDTFNSLSEYFEGLMLLKTLDFQPLRDLSLFLDLKIYDSFHINTLLKFNLLIWILSLLLVFEILQKVFQNHTKLSLYMIVLLFAVNPIFSTSICWGMARKHLLSFLFILYATKEVIGAKRSSMKIILFYTLSILSQPIFLLWPLWLLIYDCFKKNLLHQKRALYLILILLMMAVMVLNYNYYNESSVYKEFYPAKGEEFFDLWGRIQAVGHYSFQIILPYWLAFNYEINEVSSLIGLLFIVSLVIIGCRTNERKVKILGWFAFSFFPMVIVSTDKRLLSDTYILVPALGYLIIAIYSAGKIKMSKNIVLYFLVLFLFWSYRSFQEQETWKSNLNFSKNDFSKNQNCTSAVLNARMGYLENENIDPGLKQFIALNNCLNLNISNLKSNFRINEYLTVSVYMLYYENDFTLDQKINGLINLKRSHYLASFFLAAISIDENNYRRADSYIKEVISLSGSDLPFTYEPIVAKKIFPYCQKNNDKTCIDFMKHFSLKARNLYF